MRVISFNLNGIRSAAKKGFFEWFLQQDADVLCLQETKAHIHQLTAPIFTLAGYHAYFFDAHKKGYSGVAIYTRAKPQTVQIGLGFPTADTEGRYIQVNYPKLSIASLYLPSGTSGPVRQDVKFAFMADYLPLLAQQVKQKHAYVLCGDWNIAHKEIDLKNWRQNQKNSGFLPEERAWLDQLFDELGWVDAFRVINQNPGQYTWWSERAKAWDKDVGWRIDYHVVSPQLKSRIQSASIYRGQKFSDHAPVTLDYDYSF